MAYFLYSAVAHGSLDDVRVALRQLDLVDTGSLTTANGVLLTHAERANLFAADGFLFVSALRKGDAGILSFLAAHFVKNFSAQSKSPAEDFDLDDEEDLFDDLSKPIPPPSYYQMRCSFNDALFNWPKHAQNENGIKEIVDAFKIYFADEERPADAQTLSKLLPPCPGSEGVAKKTAA